MTCLYCLGVKIHFFTFFFYWKYLAHYLFWIRVSLPILHSLSALPLPSRSTLFLLSLESKHNSKLGFYLNLSLAAWGVISCTKYNRTQGGSHVYVGINSIFASSMSCLGIIFSNRDLASVCGVQSGVLPTELVVLSSNTTPLTNNSIRCTPISVLASWPGDKRWTFWYSASPLLGNYIYILFMYHYFIDCNWKFLPFLSIPE